MVVHSTIGGLDVDGTLHPFMFDEAGNEGLPTCTVPDEPYHATLDIERPIPSSNLHNADGTLAHAVEGRGLTGINQHSTPGIQHLHTREQHLKPRSMTKDQYEIFKLLMGNREFVGAAERGDATHAARAAACVLCSLDRGLVVEQGRKAKKTPSTSKLRPEGPLYSPNTVRALQAEMLEFEEMIPWNCVRKIWKNKRATWRRQVRQTVYISGFSIRIKELKQAILIEDNSIMGCGPEWASCLDLCYRGLGSSGQLDSVWDELKTAIQSWMYFNSPVSTRGEIDSLPASIALETLHTAVQLTESSDKASTLLQVPLESMIGLHSERLMSIRESLEAKIQKRVVDGGESKVIKVDTFDSGAETDEEALTDVDEAYDVFCQHI